jgi:hypothetical protein
MKMLILLRVEIVIAMIKKYTVELGHVSHYPGSYPYTGCWCDYHYVYFAISDYEENEYMNKV